MSILVRAPLVGRQALRSRFVQVRGMHVEPVPFSYNNKGVFGAKVICYMLGGFSIPFLAAYFQLKKSGAGAQ